MLLVKLSLNQLLQVPVPFIEKVTRSVDKLSLLLVPGEGRASPVTHSAVCVLELHASSVNEYFHPLPQGAAGS